jgi:hypothetical protein
MQLTPGALPRILFPRLAEGSDEVNVENHFRVVDSFDMPALRFDSVRGVWQMSVPPAHAGRRAACVAKLSAPHPTACPISLRSLPLLLQELRSSGSAVRSSARCVPLPRRQRGA